MVDTKKVVSDTKAKISSWKMNEADIDGSVKALISDTLIGIYAIGVDVGNRGGAAFAMDTIHKTADESADALIQAVMLGHCFKVANRGPIL